MEQENIEVIKVKKGVKVTSMVINRDENQRKMFQITKLTNKNTAVDIFEEHHEKNKIKQAVERSLKKKVLYKLEKNTLQD